MARHKINDGIEAADAALMFEFVEATDRAGRSLGQWLTFAPSQGMPEIDRYPLLGEFRNRFVQTVRVRHDLPAVAVFIAEKKFHDPQRAGLHCHALSATQRVLSEPLLRSFTGATVERIGRGKWRSDNGRINVHIAPNLGNDGIFNRARYALKERSEAYESRLIDQGMQDDQWGEVWKLETPAQIKIPRVILTTDAENLLAADRDRRPKFYSMLPVMQIDAAPAAPKPEITASPPRLRVVVSNALAPEPEQLSLFPATARPVSRLANFAGGIMPAAVAREVEARRHWRGLTQQQLADAIMVARPTLANVMKGRFPSSEWAAARLREFLLSPMQGIAAET